jgi:FG-GAP-like repeat
MKPVFFILVLLGLACSQKPSPETPLVPSDKSGEELAKIHCSGCHQFPDPKSLPKAIWLKSVLPKMALRFGHGDVFQELVNQPNDEMLKIAEIGVYPNKPTIAKEDWNKIVAYFDAQSAKERPAASISQRVLACKQFELKKTKITQHQVVMTKFMPISNQLLVGTADENEWFTLNHNGEILTKKQASSPLVDYQINTKNESIYLEIGILNPSEVSKGALKTDKEVLLPNLHRPVHLLLADINEDGTQDFVVASFGNLLGDVSWYDGKTRKKSLLLNQPGARVAYLEDLDQDGKKDLVVLMTQAQESVVFLKNFGKGRFQAKNLLNFPPYFGSSFMELVDIDADNDLDLICTNGDNADLSITPKAFHGLRIYENQGHLRFKETYFFPMHGASKVCTSDFDNDGDFDFSLISQFPYSNPSFVFLENRADKTYQAQTLKNLKNEKWLTMDAGDFDNDGDKDIILGAFSKNTEPSVRSSVVILKNKSKTKIRDSY